MLRANGWTMRTDFDRRLRLLVAMSARDAVDEVPRAALGALHSDRPWPWPWLRSENAGQCRSVGRGKVNWKSEVGGVDAANRGARSTRLYPCMPLAVGLYCDSNDGFAAYLM